MKQFFLLIFSLFIFVSESFAAMVTFDAANAKIQALKKAELVTQTKEMMEQGKTMYEQAKTIKDQYETMVDNVEDAKSYYDRAKRIKENADTYLDQLKSMDVLKVNGFKFDFKEPSLLQHQVESLYTDVSENPALAYFGEKYREEQRNEIAKASVANAQAIIYQQEDKAKELTELTAKYENATTLAQKQTVQNAILLNILQQIQSLTHLQAQMNAVTLSKEAEARKKNNYKKWDKRDWNRHFINGGGMRHWKLKEKEQKMADELAI